VLAVSVARYLRRKLDATRAERDEYKQATDALARALNVLTIENDELRRKTSRTGQPQGARTAHPVTPDRKVTPSSTTGGCPRSALSPAPIVQEVPVSWMRWLDTCHGVERPSVVTYRPSHTGSAGYGKRPPRAQRAVAAGRLHNTAEPSGELSVGDVVAPSEVPLAVARAGWTLVRGGLNEVRTGEHGTRPLPGTPQAAGQHLNPENGNQGE
jgi:hypothetical protein